MNIFHRSNETFQWIWEETKKKQTNYVVYCWHDVYLLDKFGQNWTLVLSKNRYCRLRIGPLAKRFLIAVPCEWSIVKGMFCFKWAKPLIYWWIINQSSSHVYQTVLPWEERYVTSKATKQPFILSNQIRNCIFCRHLIILFYSPWNLFDRSSCINHKCCSKINTLLYY